MHTEISNSWNHLEAIKDQVGLLATQFMQNNPDISSPSEEDLLVVYQKWDEKNFCLFDTFSYIFREALKAQKIDKTTPSYGDILDRILTITA